MGLLGGVLAERHHFCPLWPVIPSRSKDLCLRRSPASPAYPIFHCLAVIGFGTSADRLMSKELETE